MPLERDADPVNVGDVRVSDDHDGMYLLAREGEPYHGERSFFIFPLYIDPVREDEDCFTPNELQSVSEWWLEEYTSPMP